jgi:hypothetical protein
MAVVEPCFSCTSFYFSNYTPEKKKGEAQAHPLPLAASRRGHPGALEAPSAGSKKALGKKETT